MISQIRFWLVFILLLNRGHYPVQSDTLTESNGKTTIIVDSSVDIPPDTQWTLLEVQSQIPDPSTGSYLLEVICEGIGPDPVYGTISMYDQVSRTNVTLRIICYAPEMLTDKILITFVPAYTRPLLINECFLRNPKSPYLITPATAASINATTATNLPPGQSIPNVTTLIQQFADNPPIPTIGPGATGSTAVNNQRRLLQSSSCGAVSLPGCSTVACPSDPIASCVPDLSNCANSEYCATIPPNSCPCIKVPAVDAATQQGNNPDTVTQACLPTSQDPANPQGICIPDRSIATRATCQDNCSYEECVLKLCYAGALPYPCLNWYTYTNNQYQQSINTDITTDNQVLAQGLQSDYATAADQGKALNKMYAAAANFTAQATTLRANQDTWNQQFLDISTQMNDQAANLGINQANTRDIVLQTYALLNQQTTAIENNLLNVQTMFQNEFADFGAALAYALNMTDQLMTNLQNSETALSQTLQLIQRTNKAAKQVIALEGSVQNLTPQRRKVIADVHTLLDQVVSWGEVPFVTTYDDGQFRFSNGPNDLVWGPHYGYEDLYPHISNVQIIMTLDQTISSVLQTTFVWYNITLRAQASWVLNVVQDGYDIRDILEQLGPNSCLVQSSASQPVPSNTCSVWVEWQTVTIQIQNFAFHILPLTLSAIKNFKPITSISELALQVMIQKTGASPPPAQPCALGSTCSANPALVPAISVVSELNTTLVQTNQALLPRIENLCLSTQKATATSYVALISLEHIQSGFLLILPSNGANCNPFPQISTLQTSTSPMTIPQAIWLLWTTSFQLQLPELLNEELDVFGRWPTYGLDFVTYDFVHLPNVPADENSASCIKVQAISTPTTMEPVYHLEPGVITKQVQFNLFDSSNGQTLPLPLVTTNKTRLLMTTSVPFSKPNGYMFGGYLECLKTACTASDYKTDFNSGGAQGTYTYDLKDKHISYADVQSSRADFVNYIQRLPGQNETVPYSTYYNKQPILSLEELGNGAAVQAGVFGYTAGDATASLADHRVKIWPLGDIQQKQGFLCSNIRPAEGEWCGVHDTLALDLSDEVFQTQGVPVDSHTGLYNADSLPQLLFRPKMQWSYSITVNVLSDAIVQQLPTYTCPTSIQIQPLANATSSFDGTASGAPLVIYLSNLQAGSALFTITGTMINGQTTEPLCIFTHTISMDPHSSTEVSLSPCSQQFLQFIANTKVCSTWSGTVSQTSVETEYGAEAISIIGVQVDQNALKALQLYQQFDQIISQLSDLGAQQHDEYISQAQSLFGPDVNTQSQLDFQLFLNQSAQNQSTLNSTATWAATVQSQLLATQNNENSFNQSFEDALAAHPAYILSVAQSYNLILQQNQSQALIDQQNRLLVQLNVAQQNLQAAQLANKAANELLTNVSDVIGETFFDWDGLGPDAWDCPANLTNIVFSVPNFDPSVYIANKIADLSNFRDSCAASTNFFGFLNSYCCGSTYLKPFRTFFWLCFTVIALTLLWVMFQIFPACGVCMCCARLKEVMGCSKTRVAVSQDYENWTRRIEKNQAKRDKVKAAQPDTHAINIPTLPNF